MELTLLAVVLVCWLCSLTVHLLWTLHMFQLNGYKPGVQRKWLRDNFLPAVIGRNLAAILSLPLLFCGWPGEILAALLLLLSAWLGRPKPKQVKKPLVYTPRVRRMLVTCGILTLIPVAVSLAFWQMSWVWGLLLPLWHTANGLWLLLANFINRPVETAINRWYIEDASRMLREMPRLKVVGITGSYGKTSVKFFLQKLLSAKYNVLMTPESYNTTLGVVKTIRQSLRATHEIFLCEMGARNPGDIKEICDIVHPGYGIITSVGPQHLESFKTVENVIRTKFELRDALPQDGTVFLNWDNEYIRSQQPGRPVVRYGIEQEDADYLAYDISVSAKGSSFKMKLDGEEHTFSTRLIGSHNVLNIAGAIACAHTLGVPTADLIRQVRSLESVPHRLQLIQGRSAIIIDDAYNSNPSGAKAALDTLGAFDGVKILVTPGMVELGSRQAELNRIFGSQAAEVCDYVALVGEKQTEPILEGLLAAGFPREKIFVEHDLKGALRSVENLRTGGVQKIVLLENDLPDNF